MATIRTKGRAKSEAVETPSRLLLVDPYGGSREGLGAALRGGGLLVETAASAPEALAKMEAGEVDLAKVATTEFVNKGVGVALEKQLAGK